MLKNQHILIVNCRMLCGLCTTVQLCVSSAVCEGIIKVMSLDGKSKVYRPGCLQGHCLPTRCHSHTPNTEMQWGGYLSLLESSCREGCSRIASLVHFSVWGTSRRLRHACSPLPWGTLRLQYWHAPRFQCQSLCCCHLLEQKGTTQVLAASAPIGLTDNCL